MNPEPTKEKHMKAFVFDKRAYNVESSSFVSNKSFQLGTLHSGSGKAPIPTTDSSLLSPWRKFIYPSN